jgi:hypothetical protein
MRTIELSNAKARVILDYLAPKWAELAIKVATSNVEVNTPFRYSGETLKSPSFVRRVKRARTELSAIGDLLVGLGAKLPAVDRAAIVVPYKSPSRPRKTYSMVSTQRRQVERTRLVAAIGLSAGEGGQ